MIMAENLTAAMDELDLAGRTVIVHASLRAFGTAISGGADTFLDALLKRGCTVVAPAFTEPQFRVTAPAGMRPARNGLDYAAEAAEPDPVGPAFHIACGLINAALG